MFSKIKIARIYRKNIIIYMGVEEEQLGGVKKYRRSIGKHKKVVQKKAVAKKAKPTSRVFMSRPKPMHRGRLAMRLGGQGNAFDNLLGMMQNGTATAAPAAPATAPATHAAQQVAQFTQQQQHMHQQEGGKFHRRSKSPTKGKKVVVGKPKILRRKNMRKRVGGEEVEQEEEMVEIQSGGFQALQSLVASLSGGGKKHVVRRRPAARNVRPVVRRSASPAARRRRPVARKTH